MMTIEEKAKRYESALERCRKLYNEAKANEYTSDIEDYETIFPELRESEGERIRKELLNYLYDVHDDDEERARWIDWLEEQAEYLENYDEAEKEKGNFVGDSFIKCHANFLDFKEGNTYWLEYVGDDKYIVRSDNLLGKTYHITPRQLYTIFKKQTWLEKQGEQKPADKVEPKFHEGEWIVYKNDICQIVKREEGCNKLVTVFGIEKELVNERNLSTARIWTIQDAKDGDVLAYRGEQWIFIYKERKDETLIEYYALASEKGLTINDVALTVLLSCIVPATKEQRDLLFQKMKEAGYGWDDKDKELKKIIDEKQIKKNLQDNSFRRMFEQNPAWSEEDEEYINDLIGVFDGQQYQAHSDEEIVKWLKSIRLPYNKEWDENDEEMLRSIIATCELAEQDRDSSPARHLLEMQLDWLKSLKERVQPQTKQEWNEEDAKALDRISEILVDASEVKNWWKEYRLIERDEMIRLTDFLKSIRSQNVCAYNPYKEVVESIAEMCKHYDKTTDLQDFYDNVKVKCKDSKEYDSLYPQSQWKPSDEQMKALDIAIRCGVQLGTWEEDALKSLVEQLKKLMGE